MKKTVENVQSDLQNEKDMWLCMPFVCANPETGKIESNWHPPTDVKGVSPKAEALILDHLGRFFANELVFHLTENYKGTLRFGRYKAVIADMIKAGRIGMVERAFLDALGGYLETGALAMDGAFSWPDDDPVEGKADSDEGVSRYGV